MVVPELNSLALTLFLREKGDIHLTQFTKKIMVRSLCRLGCRFVIKHFFSKTSSGVIQTIANFWDFRFVFRSYRMICLLRLVPFASIKIKTLPYFLTLNNIYYIIYTISGNWNGLHRWYMYEKKSSLFPN